MLVSGLKVKLLQGHGYGFEQEIGAKVFTASEDNKE